jgi:hypothetical protein
VIASPIASVLFYGSRSNGPDINTWPPRFDRPSCKDAAIDELNARMLGPQRNILAKQTPLVFRHGGQLTDRFHLLSLAQLYFQLSPFGDVSSDTRGANDFAYQVANR